MPSESRPKIKDSTITIKRSNGRTWNVSVEELRLREGTVDDKGVRHIKLYKDDGEQGERDKLTAGYRLLGYEIKDCGYYIDCTISDSVYRQREAAMHAKAVARSAPKTVSGPDQDAPGNLDVSMEHLEAMSADSFQDVFGDT